MAGITVHSFLSAASGMAVAIALIRGFARRRSSTIGNYWVDLSRGTLYVLLPICVLAALFLITQGVPQTLGPSIESATLEGATDVDHRPRPGRFAGSHQALKRRRRRLLQRQFRASIRESQSADQLCGIAADLGARRGLDQLLWAHDRFRTSGMDPSRGHGGLFALGVSSIYALEARGNPALAFGQFEPNAVGQEVGGNMEGKEVRFGIAASALFANVSTASSDGAVNSMHDSFMPLSGGILLANMMVDEVIVGAPGSGLFGMLLFCVVAVFLAGLMIGRTPEDVGKKIRSSEVKTTLLALIAVPFATLGLTVVASVVEPGLAGLGNSGPHGFSEILYAYTSAAATNGSAFAGLNANSPFYNLTLGVIVIAGGLTYLPAMALGPIVEHSRLVIGALN
jgi:K+-transporting ATPase ATPase A chain